MKRSGYIVCCVLLVLSLFAPGSTAGTAQAASTGDILHVQLSEPATIDPALASMVEEAQLIGQLFSGLMKIDPLTGQAVGDLAQSWAWNPDKTQLTVTLRGGLTWSDGHVLDSSDVRYGILRTLDPDLGATYASVLFPILNAEAYQSGQVTADQVGVDVLSPTQVRFRLASPMVFFEKVLALWVAAPTPVQAITAHGEAWTAAENIVTSGPYRMADRQEGYSITLLRSASYHGAPPPIERIEIQILDYDGAWNAYLNGELDTAQVYLNRVNEIQADPVLEQQLNVNNNDCTFVLHYNVDAAPLNQLNVRKALTAAIDRQAFIDHLLGGGGHPALTYTPPSIFGHVDGVTEGVGLPFNETQARSWLASAGYPNGAGFPALQISVRDTAPNRARWDWLQQQWSAVLNVNIQVEYTAANPPTQEMTLTGWCGDYNEAYNFVYDGVQFAITTGRQGSWSNASYETLSGQVRVTENGAVRQGLYKQIETILVQTDAIIAPLWYGVNAVLTRPYLKRDFASSYQRWETWSIERADAFSYTPGTEQQFAPDADNTVYTLPDDFLPAPGTLVHTTLRPSQVAAPPADMAGIGHTFSLEIVSAGQNAPRTLAALAPAPYAITIPYSEEQLLAGGVSSESKLKVYAWTGSTWAAQSTVVNTGANTLTATTQAIDTVFSVWGPGWLPVYLPLLRR